MGKRYEHEARKFRFYYIFLFTIFERAYNFGFWSFQVDAMDGANLVFLFFLFLVFFFCCWLGLGRVEYGWYFRTYRDSFFDRHLDTVRMGTFVSHLLAPLRTCRQFHLR